MSDLFNNIGEDYSQRDASRSGSAMPAAFIGHGSPMNAVEINRYTRAWRQFGQTVTTPRAILVVSAHWYIDATVVTAMPRPRTIHDFYGFPPELYDVEYPAPGLPDLAQEIREIVRPTWVGTDHDSWGIDHGTWSVLRHAFPDPAIPVVQIAINANKPLQYHFDLGAKLAALRHRGVVIIGSGNVVHNLAAVHPGFADRGFDWAERFDNDARAALVTEPQQTLRLIDHRDYRPAVPTPDHFIPLLYFAGIAAASGTIADVLVDGYTAGSVSMASYALRGDALPGGDRPEREPGEPLIT